MINETLPQTEKTVHSTLIPLMHITYRTALTGAFAQVLCIQEFSNHALHPLEAVYTFPLPDDASITRCVMRIGDKAVEATLNRREEARHEYDDAVAGGHHASLLEQERENIFTMNVGGIEPGETIRVEIDYVERVPWQAQGGRFRIPLVVAPQFIPGVPTGRQSGGWSPDTDEVPDASRITPPVTKQSVPYHADISITFSPGFSCEVRSPSHPGIIEEGIVQEEATVVMQTGELLTDRDFTLVYTSLSDTPEVAIHRGEFYAENFLLISIIPPGTRQVDASDIVMVLDCSGSMSGPKMSGLQVVAKKVVQHLNEQRVGHRIGIVPFQSLVHETYALDEIRDTTQHFIDSLRPGGGTNLGIALQAAESMLSQDTGRPRTMLMVTDGDTEHGKNWQGQGIRLIGMGIGTAVNDTRIVDLTKRNGGVAEFVYPGEDYGAVSQRLTGFLSGPVLQDLAVETDGEVVGLTDVFQGRPAAIAIRCATVPESVWIKGKGPEGEASWEVVPRVSQTCTFAPQIWARDFIREHPTDQDSQIEVSLKYSILCPHTSFVAVSRKEIAGQQPETVAVPVCLPDTWDYDPVSLRDPHACFGAWDLEGLSLDGDYERRLTRSGRGDPIIPPVSLRPLERFTLDATHPVDRLVAILCAVARHNWDGVQHAFISVQNDMTCEMAGTMGEEYRAIAYYFALRLTKHGLTLNKEVMKALSAEPSNQSLAWSWYNLALKEQGRPHGTWVPEGYEATGYLNRKFRKGGNPDAGPWSTVV